MPRTTQRDVMRELNRRYGGDPDRVVAAYAAAERRGDVKRASNVHAMTPEEYARRLYADGVAKGWITRDHRLAARDLRVRRGIAAGGREPTHDAKWRLLIASAMRGRRPGVTEVGLDFELEPARVRIDLDNMVRLALDGLRDAGVVTRGLLGVVRIVATKRPGSVPGLGISLAWHATADDDDPFEGRFDVLAASHAVPREESPSEKLLWRDAIAAAWSGPPVRKAVGVDITVAKATSVAAMLKPVIDGLEPYLGQEPLGRGTLRPHDEQVVWLRISRIPGLPVGLRVRAGDVPRAGIGRTVPSEPSLPEMDPVFTWSTSDLEAIERHRAWQRTFAPTPTA